MKERGSHSPRPWGGLRLLRRVALSSLLFACASLSRGQETSSEVITSARYRFSGQEKLVVVRKEVTRAEKEGWGGRVVGYLTKCYKLERHALGAEETKSVPEAVLWQECTSYSTSYDPGPGFEPQSMFAVDGGLTTPGNLFFAVAQLDGNRSLSVRLFKFSTIENSATNNVPPQAIGTFRKKLHFHSERLTAIRLDAVRNKMIVLLERRAGDGRYDRWPTICLRFDLGTKEWQEVDLFGSDIDLNKWDPSLDR